MNDRIRHVTIVILARATAACKWSSSDQATATVQLTIFNGMIVDRLSGALSSNEGDQQ